MPRPAPIVVDGMRTPRAELAAQGIKTGLYARFKAALAGELADKKAARDSNPRNITFSSRYSRLRLQLTAPRDVIDNETGRKTVARPLFAQFTDSEFKVPRHISDKDAAEMIRLMRAHPKFGLGQDFWEKSDAIDEGKLRKMATVAQTLESDPDIKNGVLDWITAMEFEKDADAQDEAGSLAAAAKNAPDADDEDEDEPTAPTTPVVRTPRATPPQKATPPKRRGAPKKRKPVGATT